MSPKKQEEASMAFYEYTVDKGVNVLDVSSFLVDHDDALPASVKNAENQTDEFVPRPFLDYIPAKIGVDTGTQVEDDELAMLFLFDEEVKPLLEVIVSKTIEQALFEIEREEELVNIVLQTQEFERQQAEEAAQVLALEQAVVQDRLRVAADLEARRELILAQRALERRIGCFVFGSQLVVPMAESIFEELLQGEWRSFVTGAAEEVLAELYEEVKRGLTQRAEARAALTEIIDSALLIPDEGAVAVVTP